MLIWPELPGRLAITVTAMRSLTGVVRLSILALAMVGAAPALAQSQAPAKPYKPVLLSLPEPFKDAGFEAFRARLADAARKKDRAALGKLTVAKGFFWEREKGDGADKKKSGFDNLADALALRKADANGWDMIAAFAEDPTVSPAPNRDGAICAPGDPAFDRQAFGAMLDATQTDALEWGYPIEPGLEVRAAAARSAPTVEKLGMYFVRVLDDDSPAAAVAAAVKIATPSGKTGYVQADKLAPLGNDQICYVKEGGDWKIVGYVGEGDQQ